MFDNPNYEEVCLQYVEIILYDWECNIKVLIAVWTPISYISTVSGFELELIQCFISNSPILHHCSFYGIPQQTVWFVVNTILRWVSTHSDGGHLVLPSLGKINAISGPWRAFMARPAYPLGCQNAIYWKEVYVRDHMMPPGGNFSDCF